MEYLFVFLLSTMLFFPAKYKISHPNDRMLFFLFFILPTYLILLLFIGLRKDVGRDYNIYYNMFYLNYGSSKEFGFRFINSIFKGLNLPFSSVLILMAIFTMYFVLKIIRKQGKYSYLSFILFWLDGGVVYLLNVVRQGLTNFIFLDIIGKVKEKYYLKIIILILIASMFHYSIFLALIFIPFLLNTYSRKSLIFLFMLAIVIMLTIDVPMLFIRFMQLVPYFGEIYSNEHLLASEVLRKEFGLGYLFRFILVFLTILSYEKIAKNHKIIPYLNAFIFWGILKILTLEVWIFERVIDYLRYSSIIVVPYLIASIDNKHIRFLFGTVIFIAYFVLYLKSTIFSSSSDHLIPYQWGF
ncbi:MAG TPA: EpsG family protein [Bacillus sp. (in: firmicutes)]|nr:EpsG family protein [Bacillus sp. (in: firmicutes)]